MTEIETKQFKLHYSVSSYFSYIVILIDNRRIEWNAKIRFLDSSTYSLKFFIIYGTGIFFHSN